MEEKGSKRFGRYLRQLREDRRLTLDRIEDLSAAYQDRISKTYLSRCENGRTLPSFTKLFTLSKIYKTRLTSLAERLQLDVELEGMPPVDVSGTTFEDLASRGSDEVRRGNIRKAFLLYNAAWEMTALEEDESNRHRKEAEARTALAIALYRMGRIEMAEEECKNIVSLPDIPLRLARRALVLLSAIYYDSARRELARIMIAEAEKRIESDDPKSRADILAMKGLLQLEAADYDGASVSLRGAQEIYRSLGNRFELCKTRANLAKLAVATGRPDEAMDLYEQSLEIARREAYDYYTARRLHDIARLHYDAGRHEPARARFVESMEISRRSEFDDITFLNCFYLWRIAREHDDRAGAAINEKSLRYFSFRIETSFRELEEFRAYLEKGK